MNRLYVIGDIHGQRAMLEAAHARIAADRARIGDGAAPVVHLGDLVDRGPDSRGVIGMLLRGIAAGEPWVVLRGNHDILFADALDPESNAPHLEAWLRPNMGGRETLASYGVFPESRQDREALRAVARAVVPAAHRDFLGRLPLWHEAGEVLCVHAGIRPGLPLERQHVEDLCWIRDEFFAETGPHPWLVVHGHTPVAEVTHFGNRVAVDTGAGFGRALSAVVIEDGAVSLLTDTGRASIVRG